jgi:hypothetical protein
MRGTSNLLPLVMFSLMFVSLKIGLPIEYTIPAVMMKKFHIDPNYDPMEKAASLETGE